MDDTFLWWTRSGIGCNVEYLPFYLSRAFQTVQQFALIRLSELSIVARKIDGIADMVL